jgi:hypothetical protein
MMCILASNYTEMHGIAPRPCMKLITVSEVVWEFGKVRSKS